MKKFFKKTKKPKEVLAKVSSKQIKFYHILLLWVLLTFLSFFGVLAYKYSKISEFSLRNNSLNILVLGASGGERVGGDLTDTIILININLEKEKVSLISIPRDLWIDSLKTKINATYHYGGFQMVEDEVEKITGLDPDFSLLLDFRGFKKAIDLVGGIDVEVENTFDDYKYPIEDEDGIPVSEGELYEHIHFEKGMQVMDGETALKYARSRNSTDEIEGGDDARSRRQQKTIIAFKDKVLKFQTLMKTDNLKGFLKIFQEHVAVNLSSGDILSLSKLLPKVLKIKAFSAYSLTSDYKGEEILVSPLISKYGQWVLEPRTGDWRETRDFVLDILK